ncbi:hypothetical protein EV426DRAFT_242726 [Tirmania nivea]|nr:hypothetical protein EV426DRAFT_242726 [Tirmania nivea]
MSGSTTPLSEYSGFDNYAVETGISSLPVITYPDDWDCEKEPLVDIEDIYPDGDLIVNVKCIKTSSIPNWRDIPPLLRAKVSSTVLSVASASFASTLREVRKLNANSDQYIQQTRGVRWYLDTMEPVMVVDLVCIVENHNTVWTGTSMGFTILLKVLHLMNPDLDSIDDSESRRNCLGMISEIAWVFGCELAIESWVRLRQHEYHATHRQDEWITSDTAGAVQLSFVWKDASLFWQSTRECVISLEWTSPASRSNEVKEMGIFALIQEDLHNARNQMVAALFSIVNSTYTRLRIPRKESPKRTSRVALYLLLGTFVEAIGTSPIGKTEFPINPMGWQESPLSLMSILVEVHQMLQATWSAVQEAEHMGLTEIEGRYGSQSGAMPDVRLGSSGSRGLGKALDRFKERMVTIYQGGGLNLSDFRPVPTRSPPI